MRNTGPKAAAIYARISHDPSGERLGIQRQHVDCLAVARRRGWTIADVYIDDDLSAFNPRKPRPEYQRLLRDIRLGLRDGVMAWRLDRLHRQPRELEEFIVLCDKHHVALATATGDVDLATSQGRLLARTWGAFSAHESEVKAERLRRAFEDRARRGIRLPTGRYYGYTRRMAINPREAAVIREAVARVLAGQSMAAICADFNRRKIPSARKLAWRVTSLRAILLSPRIAGLSAYHGEVVGKGKWRAIIPRSENTRIQALLTDPARVSNLGKIPRHLLTGVLHCGRCGANLFSGRQHGERGYFCLKRPELHGCGQICVKASSLEAFILDRVFERLDSAALVDRLQEARLTNREWRRGKKLLDDVEKRLEVLAADYASGDLSRGEWLAARAVLQERIALTRPAMRTDLAERAIQDYVGQSSCLRNDWDQLEGSRRLAVISALIQAITVWPAQTTHPRSPGDRISIWWGYEPRPRMPRGAKSKGLPERRAAGKLERCRVPECVRPYRGRGYCALHLQRVKRTGTPGSVVSLRSSPYHGACCQIPGCGKPAKTRGLCDGHYDQWRSTDPSRARCAVSECPRGAVTRGWCHAHYHRWWKAQRRA